MKTKKEVENKIKELPKSFFKESSPIRQEEKKEVKLEDYKKSEFFLG